MALRGNLSVEVFEIVQRMAKFQTILEKAWHRTIGASEVDFATAYKAEHEFHTCIDCLRRVAPRNPTSTGLASAEQESTTIEHVVCLALIAFSNSVFGCMTYGPLFKASQEALATAIRSCELEQGQEDCLIWARAVAVWAESMNTGVQSEIVDEVVGRILSDYGNGRGWEALDNTIQRFLWTEDMVGVCEKTWVRASLEHVAASQRPSVQLDYQQKHQAPETDWGSAYPILSKWQPSAPFALSWIVLTLA